MVQERTQFLAAGAIATVALHSMAAAALIGLQTSSPVAVAQRPIEVEWLQLVETPPPAPPRPKPTVRRAPPVQKARPAPAPAEPVAAPAPAPEPEPVASPPPAAPAPVAAAAPAAEVVLTPPVFNAAYLQNPPPAYPPLSRRTREQGRVVLRVLVGADGCAAEVGVRASSGHQRLDEAAQETVRRWKFIPARRGADPVPAWVLVPINFTLEG